MMSLSLLVEAGRDVSIVGVQSGKDYLANLHVCIRISVLIKIYMMYSMMPISSGGPGSIATADGTIRGKRRSNALLLPESFSNVGSLCS